MNLFNEYVLFNELRQSLFGGRISQVQVDSVKAIISEAQRTTATLPMLAYMLGTAWHEARLKPVREGFADTDAEARRIVAHRPYGKPVNGHVYYGRGFVQLTWYENYKAWGIANDPDKALQPEFAAKVLVRGMLDGRYNGAGKGLAFYLDRPKPDWKNARRTVNITDRWEMIRDYALVFQRALEVAAEMYEPGVNAEAKSDKLATGTPPSQSTTIWSALLSWVMTNGSLLVGLAKEQPWLFAAILLITSIFAFWIIRERLIKSREFGI